MYRTTYDAARKFLDYVIEGYWTMDEFHAFESEIRAHHQRIRKLNKSYRVLSDARDFAVQSVEVSDAFAALFKDLLDDNKGHFAILAASALNSMQAKRALPQANVRVFTDKDEAMAWLFEDGSLPE